MEDVGFREYLSSRHAAQTVRKYLGDVSHFGELLGSSLASADYKGIMEGLALVRKEKGGTSHMLTALRKYYGYLVDTGQRIDDPTAHIRTRDSRKPAVQLQDLFTSQELELLLEVAEPSHKLLNRNRLIVSLLVYQGLTTGELQRLRVGDIDGQRGRVEVTGGHGNNGRGLGLRANQVYWLLGYLNVDRPRLLSTDTDRLLLGQGGRPIHGDSIGYLLERRRHLFPKRKLNAQTIRQSVIANLLRSGHDVRKVQAFAGHRYPSTTERYKQQQVEELRAQVEKLHPLG